MLSLTKLLRSVKHAWRGLVYAWRHEQNFRIQTFIGCVVVGAGLWLGLSELRMVLVLLLVMTVLLLELVNTFFEKLVDMLSPRVHTYVGMLKDLLAAIVFVAAVGSVVIGFLIFYPYIF